MDGRKDVSAEFNNNGGGKFGFIRNGIIKYTYRHYKCYPFDGDYTKVGS